MRNVHWSSLRTVTLDLSVGPSWGAAGGGGNRLGITGRIGKYMARGASRETLMRLLPSSGAGGKRGGSRGDAERKRGPNHAGGYGTGGMGLISTRSPPAVSRGPAGKNRRDGNVVPDRNSLGDLLSQNACEPLRSPVSACAQRVGAGGRRRRTPCGGPPRSPSLRIPSPEHGSGKWRSPRTTRRFFVLNGHS